MANNTVNFVELIGFVGTNPEIRYAANGNAVLHFSLGTVYTQNNQEMVDWHNVTIFGKLAESLARYVAKGRRLRLTGRIHHSRFVGTDGRNVRTDEIIADSVLFLDSKNPVSTQTNQATQAQTVHQPQQAGNVPAQSTAPAAISADTNPQENPDDIAALVNETVGELIG